MMNKTVLATLTGALAFVAGGGAGVAIARKRPGSGPALAEPPYFVYTVQEGDTLSALALRFFGDAAKAPVLFAAMPKLPDDGDKGLPIGAKINVPCVWVTVQSGENLSTIAQRTLGDSGRWTRIYEANKGALPDPNKVGVGQRLAVPMEPTPATAVGRGGHGGGHGGLHGGHGRGGGALGPVIYDPLYPDALEVDDEGSVALASHRPRMVVVGDGVAGDLDFFEADEVGGMDFGFGTAFQAAGDLAKTGLTIASAEQAQNAAQQAAAKAGMDETGRLNAATFADALAAQAIARATVSAASKGPTADIDAIASTQAQSQQSQAGAGLSAASQGKRLQQANVAMNAAIQKAEQNPKDPYAMALVKAWQTCMNKIQNGQIVGPPAVPPPAGAAPAGGASAHADGIIAKLLKLLHLRS